MDLQPIALIAHTKSENRLAFTLVIDRRPSSRRPPVDLEEAGQARRLKASGGQVVLLYAAKNW
jgi:hypothetical protein